MLLSAGERVVCASHWRSALAPRHEDREPGALSLTASLVGRGSGTRERNPCKLAVSLYLVTGRHRSS
eukprot:2522611-Prymnesium_polylepis.1